MNTLKFLFSKTLLYFLWQECWIRWHFKFALPKITEIELENIRLDVSTLSPKARHRLLYVGYETAEKVMCRDFLTRNDSVLELGAAIGFIGLYCQKNLGIRDYVLVEANPRTLAVLKRNYQLNGLTPNALNVALAPNNGRVELNVETDFWENSILPANHAIAGRKTMDVPAATLETLLANTGHHFNTLIIDVEGAEQFIDFKQLPASIDKIIMELHPTLIGPEKTYDIISKLVAKEFRVVREQSGTFVFLKAPIKGPGINKPAVAKPESSRTRRAEIRSAPSSASNPVESVFP